MALDVCVEKHQHSGGVFRQACVRLRKLVDEAAYAPAERLVADRFSRIAVQFPSFPSAGAAELASGNNRKRQRTRWKCT